MCTNKKKIFNRYNHKWFYVDCGHCPACQQARANRRASRIRANFEPGLFAWFVHLTYLNECVPYIKRDEISSDSKTINIYRDYDRRYSRRRNNHNKRNYLLSYHRLHEPIDKINLENEFGVNELSHLDNPLQGLKDLNDTYHRRITSQPMAGKVGIIYYKDLQNYIKKVKQNLLRKYNIDTNEVHFSYYATSEYGTKKESLRPHFHLLVFCPRTLKAQFYDSLVSCWTFAFRSITERRLEPAIDASKYCASYINKPASFPPLLSCHSFRQKFSYSQGFGMGLQYFRLDKILQKIKSGDMRYPRQIIVNGAPQQCYFSFPSYVVNRYFPKIKGYSRLTSDSFRWLYRQLGKFSGIPRSAIEDRLRFLNEVFHLGYVEEDFHKTATSLFNHYKSSGLSPKDYANAYVGAWSSYYSTLYRQLLENKSIYEQLECYDNILDFYTGDVGSISMDELMFHIKPDYDYKTDPNDFRENVAVTECLTQQFNKFVKQRQVNSNFIEVYA